MAICYIGSYTELITNDFGGHGKGIYTVNLDEKTGKLYHLHTCKTLNPAYLTISDNKRFLYTITEVLEEKKPKVKAYKITSYFSLKFINELDIPGGLPCHISFHNNFVFVACYGSGNFLCYETNNQGELVKQTYNFLHSGSSINKERQEGPHAHQSMIHPGRQHVFVPDLGIDQVNVYTIEGYVISKAYNINIPKGEGPRHIVFNKTGQLGYLLNELTGDVSILKKEEKHFKFYKNIKSLPRTFNEIPGASAIRLHPKKPYLYVANRTIDTITIFKTINEDLHLIGYQYTNGKTLREFNISPDGVWLIACLQDSDETVVYKIQQEGTLQEVSRTQTFLSPVCVGFM